MADISNVVNLSLLQGGTPAQADNMNICAVITGLQGVLSTAERFRAYASAPAVAADWGSSHEVTADANVFFAQQPNPVNAGGSFIVGYYRQSTEAVAATAAQLLGGSFASVNAVVAALQLINDGEFDIDIDGGTLNITALDFTAITSLADAAAIVQTALVAALAATTCVVAPSGDQLQVTSPTTGVASTITVASAAAAPAGTDVSTLLALGTGTGAVATQGAAADTLAVETALEGATAVKAEVNFKGFKFAQDQTAADHQALAAWAQANEVLYYPVFALPAQLEVDPTQAPWAIKLASQKRTRMLFRKDANNRFGTGYMARQHVMNFDAENSAHTMHLKEIINVPAEAFSQTEIDKAARVGLDIYTTVKLSPVLFTSGANGYTDAEYILLGFADRVRTDLFNLLKTTPTKIAQTQTGIDATLDTAELTSRAFVRNGSFAPGTWNAPIPFGDSATFLRNIEQNGYYWIAGALADQTAAQRNSRKAPVVQGAVKFSGAFHCFDALITINE